MPDADLERLVEILGSRLWGKYRATVTDNAHETRVGWIEVKVHGVLGDRRIWARPSSAFAGSGSGFYCMPDVDALVWVEFEGGDTRDPVWTGCFWRDEELADAGLSPGRKIFCAGKLRVVLDEDAGEVVLENGEASRIVIKGDEIVLEASRVVCKSGSNRVELSAGGFDMLAGALKVV